MSPAAGAVPWRLLDTGEAPGSANLALDEALFLLAQKGACVPTLRFYAWNPPAVSVGYFQAWEREIDEASCRREGIDIVRRITGGRAVLHREEVTYSVVCGGGGGFFDEGIWPAYRKIGLALAEGLRLLGVAAQVVVPDRKSNGSRPHHPSCFSSSIGYEISAAGEKLVGSAQKRQGGALLQHGSILLEDHGEDFLGLLKSRPPANNGALKMGSLSSALGRPPDYGDVVRSLAEGFRTSWEVSLLPGELTGKERGLAEHLEGTKYRSPRWTGRERCAAEAEKPSASIR
jgi:lipoate-protein ligase A